MKAILEDNPLYKLYNILNYCICNINNYEFDKESDEIIDLILQGNKYKFEDNYKTKTLELYNGFYLYLVLGINHEDEKNYDFIDIYGSKYLIIFLDTFKYLSKENPYDEILGNSIQFNAIKSIIEFYISITTNVNRLAGTIQADTYYVAPSVIAAAILDNVFGLTENDVEGNNLNYEYLRKVLSTKNGVEYTLLGIY